MMSKEALTDLCARAVRAAKRAGADEAEVYAEHDRDTTVSFQKNDLDQVSEAQETTFGVRVFRNNSMGFATSNRPDQLNEVVAAAVDMARHTPADEFNRLPAPQPVPDVPDQFDPALLAWTTAELVQMGTDLLKRVLAADARVTVDTADLSVSEVVRAIVSSNGVCAAHHSAAGSGGIFGMAVDGDEVGSFSYDGDVAREAALVQDAVWRSYERFVHKAVGALGAGAGHSFTGAIILPPEEVARFLVGPLLSALGADAVRRGTSPLADRVGDLITTPSFTLFDGGRGVSDFLLAPFDREGTPRKRLTLIENGRLNSFLYDGYEGNAAGRPSTGHAGGGAASPPSVSAGCVGIAPGGVSKDEVYGVDQAVIVTRFSGSQNASSGDFSGVVKGGFLLKDGERRPIHETTLTGNLYESLNQITAISSETAVLHGTQNLPWIRIDGVSISAA